MNNIKKSCFIFGSIFSGVALVFLSLLSNLCLKLTPENHESFSTAIKSPPTSIAQLHNIAETKHTVVIQFFEIIDIVIESFLVFMALSAIGFLCLGFYAHKQQLSNPSFKRDA